MPFLSLPQFAPLLSRCYPCAMFGAYRTLLAIAVVATHFGGMNGLGACSGVWLLFPERLFDDAARKWSLPGKTEGISAKSFPSALSALLGRDRHHPDTPLVS